jgi:tripartite-type tricarboxylate transporter receptor subunit TctC
MKAISDPSGLFSRSENGEIHRALELADVKQRLKEGGNIAAPTTPEVMRRQIEDEIAHWKQIVEANHIKVN